jgi:hypothetical protein
MNTCRPAIHTIIRLSITLKLKILLSVLLTVLKFRFSLVRKYFCILVMVESWPDSLKIDSSSAEVCSGDVPCLDGIEALSSFSTYCFPIHQPVSTAIQEGRERRTYRNLKIHKLVRERAHLVVKAKPILPRLRSREDKIPLSLFLPIHNDIVPRSENIEIDIKGATCLNLFPQNNQSAHLQKVRREKLKGRRETSRTAK